MQQTRTGMCGAARRRPLLAFIRVAACWPIVALFLHAAVESALAHPPEPAPYPSVPLTVDILDAQSRQPLAARIRVVGADGRDYYPLPRQLSLYHESYFGQHYFYADGSFTVTVPVGRTVLWISHGLEYLAFRDTFDVAEPLERQAALLRFTDQSAWGWRSGDTHIHINHGGDDVYSIDTDETFVMQRAEDLNVANVLEDETRFTGTIDPRSTIDHLLYFGGEYRSAFWGHLDVLGVDTLPYLFCCSAGQPAYPMDIDLLHDVRSRGGMVFFAHPITVPRNQMDVTDNGWPSVGHGRALPVDVALGAVDAMDVMSYSNLNRIEFPTWYDLLNHGFRIPATAGTDASVNRTTDPPMGGYRMYAQVGPGPFTYRSWLEAARRGESYITNGPLIQDFKVDGRPAGSVLAKVPATAHGIPVQFEVLSQWPIMHVSLIVNGVVQRLFYPTGSKLWYRGSTSANLGGKSGWVAILVTCLWPNPGPYFTIGNWLYAHSNPVYVDVPDQPLRFDGANPMYYVQWIDDVWNLADARGWGSPAERDTVLARMTLAHDIVLSRTVAAPEPLRTHKSNLADALGRESEAGGALVQSRPATVQTRAVPGAVQFRFSGAPAAPETFDLFDVQGRPVLTRRLDQFDATDSTWTWHRELSGGALPRGLYFARFRGAGWSATTRVVSP